MALVFCAMRITGRLVLRIWPKSPSRPAWSSWGELTRQSSPPGSRLSHPHTARHETPGTSRAQVVDRVAGPRQPSPVGWFLLPTPKTVAALSAFPQGECGLVGLKPTRGRVSCGPDLGEFMEGLAVEFAVTRTMRDAAALL